MEWAGREAPPPPVGVRGIPLGWVMMIGPDLLA
jgi:hypothetical protein